MSLYWWFAMINHTINEQALHKNKFHISQVIFWLKNSLVFSQGQLYHRIHEPCIVGWKRGKTPYRNSTFSNLTELWTTEAKTFMDHLDIWYQKRDNTQKYIHATQKPVRLAERALKRSSEKGDLVLDAFLGSGSTMIACEQLERNCRGIELDGKYCDAAITRYCQYVDNFHIKKNGKDITW